MYTVLVSLLFILGLFFIVRSGDLLVDASFLISEITGVSKLIIGATLVSLATALPEICVSLIGITNNLHYLAVGNAVGSMICNLALVISIAIIIAPGKIKQKSFNTKSDILIVLTTILFIFCLDFKITPLESFVLLSLFIAFFVYNFLEAKQQIALKKELTQNKVKKNFSKKLIIKTAVKFLLGTLGIFVGANMLVRNGQVLATLLNINSEIIGLTVIAFGTCLPELITTIVSIKKESMSLALGNVMGANIINITLLFGLGGLLGGSTGLRVPVSSVATSIPILLLLTLILIVPIIAGKKTYKKQGIMLMAIYVIYTIYIIAKLFF